MRQLGKRNARSMEFHVSRAARMRYQLDETLFSMRGNVIFANVHAARMFIHTLNLSA